MLNTVEMADAYFARNFFYKDAWAELDTATKELLINTAENDVNAYLRCQNIDINVVYNTFIANHVATDLTFWVCGNVPIYYTDNGLAPYNQQSTWGSETTTLQHFKPTCYQSAVFEWAIFIYQHKDDIMRAFDNISKDISSVKVDNIGTETYWVNRNYGLQNDTYMRIFKKSPAMRFLDMIPKDIRIIR